MTKYVYDFPSTGAKFYIEGNYVYRVGGGAPAYEIKGDYWYKHPPDGQPLFYVNGIYIYDHPPSGLPKYYVP